MIDESENVKPVKWHTTTRDLKRALANWDTITSVKDPSPQTSQDFKKIEELKERIAEVKLILKQCGMDI